MAGSQKAPGKKKARPFEPLPAQLDWFAEKGADIRLGFIKEHNALGRAKKAERALSRKSLNSAGKEMDDYLRNYRAAENALLEIVSKLSDPRLKKEFLSRNPQVSAERYENYLEKLSRRAEMHGKRAWDYEKRYSRQYGKKRQVYKNHLEMRSEAREFVRAFAQARLEDLEHGGAGGERLAVVYSPKGKKRAPAAKTVAKERKGPGASGRGAIASLSAPESLEQVEKLISRLKKEREESSGREKMQLTRRINKLRRERERLRGEMA